MSTTNAGQPFGSHQPQPYEQGIPANQPVQPGPYGPINPHAPFPQGPAPAPKKSHKFRNALIGSIAALALIGGCSAMVNGNSSPTTTAQPSATVSSTTSDGGSSTTTTDDSATTESKPAPKKIEAAKPKATAKPKPAKPAMSNSERQAVGSAEDYLDSGQHFSKKGLISQLKFEGFSTADAKYAVNHVKVNWTEQADGAAQDYLDSGQHFSHSGLLSQLKFEGFTQAQAAHGVRSVGL